MLQLLNDIDPSQTIFTDKQSCSFEDFMQWHKSVLIQISENKFRDRDIYSAEAWLWVASMCVVYGLRPTEIAAIQNFDENWESDEVIVPRFDSIYNTDLLIVIGEFTYFGASTKTGLRICKPMIAYQDIWEELKLKQVKMPVYEPTSTKPSQLCKGFSTRFNQWLKRLGCPVTQAYAFRHLSNQLGEKYGIPQEIRARSLGHSVAVNDNTYKSRHNLKTEVDMLLNHSRQPLEYEVAVERIKAEGIDISTRDIAMALRIIYQQDLRKDTIVGCQ